ncbi:MAG: alpha/beta hydrolase [Bacteroidetes bacterium]|nr:alpha/beta hydrolase [Bacteroidota bacterium]
MNKQITSLFTMLFFLFITSSAQINDTVPDQFANIDGIKIHYKIYGKGDPLILLHGSLESMKDWAKQVPEFSRHYQVITVDNRGHGMSTFEDRKMDYALLSEDVLKLMSELKIDSAHIVGFGDGGIMGLYLAINHPEKVRKLVAIGANYKVDTTAVYGQILNKVKAWDNEKMYQFVKNNFKGYQNFSQITQFTQRMKTMLLTEPNLTLNNLREIKCPVLFIAGDHDIIKLTHTDEMFENVKYGNLLIVPGTKHYPQKEKPQLVNTAIQDFLNKRFVSLSRF